ncbi:MULTISPECIES: TetR/AcrR family transcriptional regulator [unclassified Mesorhizobium]|uniref:TetR/AcrR family transcriptional regulator n=1 Tax=unclassified Mesorhizobium TaxID=325217 RepID=UPI000FD5985D|nr:MULTISPECIES: TetR/AcrR family transcriptional regulator [unclassified Mesorhizobium]RUX00888.1 TetR/AcrR family transcriptional regulator [Mesorhizobium sp. M8A.F.Ca.ET.023.01.1.1]RUX05184.1 TetR/AcrR family transcriptional regulator [Mesorhizobium sp. M8A.F.Ca.ET.059.01.1.1]RWC73964.1 MAG: TetR/AcrR family transcriptional regulator [Mesorhizobium sp.]TGR58631.1 TetR/AcrR family transcriptional regulator [bacterium M00.F.Ca.ET.199.01.1.1]TGU41261.1 TetR/AcrR family transcriptional regulato
MAEAQSPTRKRLVDAATRLFYAEGIGRVSVDAVAEEAGLTKRTLYYHFKSKDDLIAAYLDGRDQPNLKRMAGWFEAEQGGVDSKVEAIFTNLARATRHPKWKGCGFLRTAAELASMPGHPAVKVGARHKSNFETWLATELSGHDIEGPQALAREIVLLIDGCFSIMLIHRNPDYVEAAGRAAATLVRARMSVSQMQG